MKKYVSILIVIVILAGCDPPDTGGGSQHPTGTDLRISSFIGTCWLPNSIDPVGYDVDVYVETLDNTSGLTSIFWHGTFFGNTGYVNQPIQVPASGTYSVEVTITARDCSECCIGGTDCSGEIVYDQNGDPIERKAGYPRWRGRQTFLNQTAKPRFVEIIVNRTSCRCLCNVPF